MELQWTVEFEIETAVQSRAHDQLYMWHCSCQLALAAEVPVPCICICIHLASGAAVHAQLVQWLCHNKLKFKEAAGHGENK